MEAPPYIQSRIENIEGKVKDAESLLEPLKNAIKETLRKAISDNIEDRKKALQLIDDVKYLTAKIFSIYMPVRRTQPKTPLTVKFLLFKANTGIYDIAPRVIDISPTDIIINMGWMTKSLLERPSITILLTLIYHIDNIYKEYTELYNKETNNIIEKRTKVAKLVKILEEKIKETLEPLGKDLDEDSDET